jgi:phosphatidylglycerol---prolipoprotein diacylglyceryl transferase
LIQARSGDVHPVLFSVGPFDLRMYNLMIAIAILAGAGLAVRRAGPKGRHYRQAVWHFTAWGVLGGLIGARLWEVLWSLPRFTGRPGGVLAFWEGGMSVQGAVLGGLAAALLYARWRRLDRWGFLDDLAPGLALGQGIGRIGCLFNGDAFGIPAAQVGWWPESLSVVHAPGTPAHEAFGAQPLLPAEAMEGLADFAICALLLRIRPGTGFSGRRTLAYGILYSTARFLLEYWRGDSVTAGPWKVAQLLSLAAAGCCVLLWALRSGKAGAARVQT